jgi:hypothetical protein
MNQKIILKKSSVPGKEPQTSDLQYGELAINYADGKIFYKRSDNTIQKIESGIGYTGSRGYTGSQGEQGLRGYTGSAGAGSGASFGNLDGGHPDSNYGGIQSIDAGGVT